MVLLTKDTIGQWGEVGDYAYFRDRQIPFNAWSGSILTNPQTNKP